MAIPLKLISPFFPPEYLGEHFESQERKMCLSLSENNLNKTGKNFRTVGVSRWSPGSR